MVRAVSALGSLIAMVLLACPANAFDEAVFCATLKQVAKKTNAEGPVMLDAFTRLDGVSVLCATRIVDFKKFVTQPTPSLREGWENRKQDQWNSIYCDDPSTREAIANGWTIAQTTIFVDGSRHWMKAICP